MVILRKMLFPLLRKYLRLFISMTLTAALGLGFVIGLWGAYTNLVEDVDTYCSTYQSADVTLNVLEAKTDLSYLKDLKSVSDISYRRYSDCSVLLEDKKITTRLFTYNEDESITKLRFREQISEEGIEGKTVYVEYNYAKANHIELGDVIKLSDYNLVKEYTVTAYVSSVETMSVKQNRFMWGESSDFGYMYTRDEFDKLRSNGFYTQVQIKTSGTKSNADTLMEIKKNLPKTIYLIESYTFEDSPTSISIDLNLKGVYSLSSLSPFVFFSIVALIIFLFMLQILKQERSNIGIYKALGFENKDIIPLFIVTALVISAFAIVLGIAVSYGLTIFILRIYLDNFSIAFQFPRLDVGITVIISLICTLVCVTASMLAILPVLRIEPIEAMMTQGSTLKEPKAIRRLKLPLQVKLSISMALRNIKRFVFSTVCIMASISLIVASLFVNQAGKTLINQTYEKRLDYDAIVYYSGRITNVTQNKYESAECITEYQIIDIALPDIEYNGKKYSSVVFGMSDTSLMHIVDSTGKKNIPLPKEGILLDERTATYLGCGVGDTVLVNEKEVLVAGISRQYVSSLCYMDKVDMEQLDLIYIQAVLCNCTDHVATVDFVSKTSGYSSMEFVSNLKEYTENCFKTINSGVYIMILFSVFIGVIVIYNISQINLKESQREIAVMKTLGVRQSYISMSWFMESFIQWIIACIVGLPFGTFLASIILRRMKSQVWEYPLDPNVPLYFVSITIAFVFIVICHFISMLSIRRWNLADLTRSKE